MYSVVLVLSAGIVILEIVTGLFFLFCLQLVYKALSAYFQPFFLILKRNTAQTGLMPRTQLNHITSPLQHNQPRDWFPPEVSEWI